MKTMLPMQDEMAAQVMAKVIKENMQRKLGIVLPPVTKAEVERCRQMFIENKRIGNA